jgi:hypothetical protein
METPYDKAALSHLDVSLRTMVDRSYDLCLYRCNEDREKAMLPCKQNCFKRIQVPYRHSNHVAKDGEENAYRKCLANSQSFPAVSQEDFIACSNVVFQDRIEVLTNQVADEATRIMNIARS